MSKNDAQISKQRKHYNENIFSLRNKVDRRTESTETNNGDLLDIDATVDEEMVVLRERRGAISTSLYRDTKSLRRGSGSRSSGYDLSDTNRGSGKLNRKHQSLNHGDRAYNNDDPPLDKIVRDIRHRVKDLKKLWSNLSKDFCDDQNANLSSTEIHNSECWNGHTVDRYVNSQ